MFLSWQMAENNFYLNLCGKEQYNYLFQICYVIMLTADAVTVIDKCKANYAGQII